MRSTSCLIALLAILAPAGVLASGQQGGLFRAATRLVVLQATVTGERGEAVTGLDAGAFVIKENGKPQRIAIFRQDDAPISLGIVLDNSGSMTSKRSAIERAALSFIAASNPDDEVFVMNFADDARVDVPLTSDVDAVESGMKKLDAAGGTALRDALNRAVVYLSTNARHERKAILLVTDGSDNSSVASKASIRDLLRRAQVSLFAVGLLGNDRSPGAEHGRDELEQLTESSGGLAYFPARLEDIHNTVVAIARQLRLQYTLAYTPTDQSLDGSYRRITVAIAARRHAKVRTRPGYIAAPLH